MTIYNDNLRPLAVNNRYTNSNYYFPAFSTFCALRASCRVAASQYSNKIVTTTPSKSGIYCPFFTLVQLKEGVELPD